MIRRTSPVIAYHVEGNDPPAQDINIPAGTNHIVFTGHIFGEGTLALEEVTLDGVPLTIRQNLPMNNGQDSVFIAHGPVTTTGFRQLNWSWSDFNIIGGPSVFAILLSGVNNSDSYRDSDAVVGSGNLSFTGQSLKD